MNLKFQFFAVLATEHPGADLIRSENVGSQTGVGVPFDIIENYGWTTVQRFLNGGHLTLGINLMVGFKEQALIFQPFKICP